jgi:hypothetical protein
MNDPAESEKDRSFTRMAGIVAIASLPLAFGNLLAMLASVHFDLNGISDPLVLLRSGGNAPTLWRLSMVLDIAGYYLAILPLLVLLHASLRQGRHWVDLGAICLVAYSVIGAIGGAELATAVPTLMKDFVTASGPQRFALQTTFTGYTDGIYRGMWNLLEEFLAGVGWLCFAYVLAEQRRKLSRLTACLGVACIVDAVGSTLGADAISSAGLIVYLVLAPIWAFLLGRDALRARAPFAPDPSRRDERRRVLAP